MIDINDLAWQKVSGMVPAIIQDHTTGDVLMLGYMTREALEQTLETNRVTFFSRSRQCLWTKGETSGHYLELISIKPDCDRDTLLITVDPVGPTCHTGTQTCWGQGPMVRSSQLGRLGRTISSRSAAGDESSYTARLLESGLPAVSQKVGEEAVETVIAALAQSDDELVGEVADLLYHTLVLLKARDLSLDDVCERLIDRAR